MYGYDGANGVTEGERRKGNKSWDIDELVDQRPENDPLVALTTTPRPPQPSEICGADLRVLVAGLPVMERLVIRWRFGIGSDDDDDRAPSLSAEAISRRIGVTRKTVYNIERRALQQLREACVDFVDGQTEAAQIGAELGHIEADIPEAA